MLTPQQIVHAKNLLGSVKDAEMKELKKQIHNQDIVLRGSVPLKDFFFYLDNAKSLRVRAS